MVLSLALKTIYIISQRRHSTSKETVEKDILITFRFSDGRVTQPIRTTSDSKELFHKNKEFETILSLDFFTNF